MLSYRALERLPALGAHVSAAAEPLDAFLRSQEQAIEKLLAEQEEWAEDSLRYYADRPSKLAFKADTTRSEAQRRTAFFEALRISASSRFALYVQPDPWAPPPKPAALLPSSAVRASPDAEDTGHVFVRIAPGERVPALAIVATASDEPDLGMDIGLWSDSNTPAGDAYDFGDLPFGNPQLAFSTQAPFHMGFLHEPSWLYMAAPFIKRTYPLWRIHQFTGLARLAFDTGHPYWGWRFTGLAMHYVQDMTQPYHAKLAPGSTNGALLKTNLLALVGFSERKRETITLLSNRHLALEHYESALVRRAAREQRPTAIEAALRNFSRDPQYPPWSEHYVRDVVSLEAWEAADSTNAAVMAAMPAQYVSDPSYDFGVNAAQVDVLKIMSMRAADKRQVLDNDLTQLLLRFGAHSRALVRDIAKPRSAAPTQ